VFSEARNYKAVVSGYSGNAGDAFQWHGIMMFTTYDRDNDPWTHSDPGYKNNCAVYNGGGFWYDDGSCSAASVNVVRDRGDDFKWWSESAGYFALQTARMWLVC